MTETYLLPKAVNLVTGQTVKQQDLTGARFKLSQRAICEEMAQRLADTMTQRTGESWAPQVVEYTPTYRREQ
jgi:hypothetical protein